MTSIKVVGQVCTFVVVPVLALLLGGALIPIPKHVVFKPWHAADLAPTLFQSFTPESPDFAVFGNTDNFIASKCTKILKGLRAPETVTFDNQGNLYAFTRDGVIRVPAAKVSSPEVPTGASVIYRSSIGRPLSGAFHPTDGKLYFVDVAIGLLTWDPVSNVVEIVSTEADGKVYGFVDDLDFGPDGTVYFSDASEIKPFSFDSHGDISLMTASKVDIFSVNPTGRLIAYNPQSKRSSVFAAPFYFANGVAVSADGKSVLVSESGAFRVSQVSLSDGSISTFTTKSLPGTPDSISLGRKTGKLWVAIVKVLDPPVLPLLKSEFIRKLLAPLPDSMIPAKPYGLFVQVNGETGEIEKTFHDPSDKITGMVTSIAEHDGHLYLGTLESDNVVQCPIP
eukprot:TRINITY_DN2647_c0_g1_i1.p1 TRINITY_DN2647_c0_g1~~TRINITY_DN2647_c0_g1_i1.p1  ORF type:complete len:394 (-),score=106.50 TRINITY_DN2647_c0_g1_i1:103-1284(-)